jgi:hypothetical protein
LEHSRLEHSRLEYRWLEHRLLGSIRYAGYIYKDEATRYGTNNCYFQNYFVDPGYKHYSTYAHTRLAPATIVTTIGNSRLE